MPLRRAFLMSGLVAMPVFLGRKAFAQSNVRDVQASFADLEMEHGGRLGVCVLDVATGRRTGHRADDKFAMCSTFKVLAAAAVLTSVDRGETNLDRRIVYASDRMVPYSPETEKHVGDEGMTLGEICKAALTLSDNTAGNLMLEIIGGPAGLTQFARSIGDDVTRLDRIETGLNEATPGDPRDTTTPAAMLGNLQRIILGNALSEQSRDQMTNWMVANKTGDKRLRAGIPKTWRIGDKTGTGDHAETNDIGVIWPPNRDPILVTVLFAESPASEAVRSAVIADVARLAVKS